MVEALQLELGTPYQTRDIVYEKEMTLEQENIKLQQENVHLKQENASLLQEVNNMKQEYVNLEHRLTRSFYKIHSLRERQQSSVSVGQVMTAIGGLVVAFLLLYYGMGFVEYSAPSSLDNDGPVVERLR